MSEDEERNEVLRMARVAMVAIPVRFSLHGAAVARIACKLLGNALWDPRGSSSRTDECGDYLAPFVPLGPPSTSPLPVLFNPMKSVPKD